MTIQKGDYVTFLTSCGSKLTGTAIRYIPKRGWLIDLGYVAFPGIVIPLENIICLRPKTLSTT